jgi:hypothetical protein
VSSRDGKRRGEAEWSLGCCVECPDVNRFSCEIAPDLRYVELSMRRGTRALSWLMTLSFASSAFAEESRPSPEQLTQLSSQQPTQEETLEDSPIAPPLSGAPPATEPPLATAEPKAQPEPTTPRVPEPLAISGSIIPGILAHGTGSWLLGDDDTARRLLIAEGIGLTTAAGSLSAIALTGAARHWIGLLATTTMLGAGAFGVTFLADVYRTTVPNGFGKHSGAIPWGMSQVGVLWVNNPQFDLGPIVESSGIIRAGRWSADVLVGHSPSDLHYRLRMESGYRLWGALAQRQPSNWGGSHSTLSMAYEDARFGEAGFRSSGTEVRWWGRADSEQWAPNVRGAFVDWEVGIGGKVTTYVPSDATSRETFLLGGFGFGAYHGEPATVGGETRIYYSHRHDGYVGGLLMPGLGSGVIGSFGLDSRHFFSPTWGVRMVSEIGAAWTLGLYVVIRAWSESSTSNGLFDFGDAE